VLDNEQLYAALAQYFDEKAVAWFENTAIESPPEDGVLNGFDQAFDWVFDCRGNGARSAQSALRSVRGEVIRVYAPEVNIKHAVRMMHPRYPLYIAPRPNHQYVIGATQIESEHDTPVTVRSGLELLSALYSLHKGFAEAQIISLDVGCRPAYDDNLPRLYKHKKLIQINGLYRHGFLFAPALVNEAMALMSRQTMQFPEVLHS
jgi:glycine oxidase